MLQSVISGKRLNVWIFNLKMLHLTKTPPEKLRAPLPCVFVWQADRRRRGDSTLLSVSSAGCKTWTGLSSPPSSSSVDAADGLNLPVSCWPRYVRHQAAESRGDVLVTDTDAVMMISSAFFSFSWIFSRGPWTPPFFCHHLLIFPHSGSKERPLTTFNTVALLFIFVFCAGFGLSCWFSGVLAPQNVDLEWLNHKYEYLSTHFIFFFVMNLHTCTVSKLETYFNGRDNESWSNLLQQDYYPLTLHTIFFITLLLFLYSMYT